MTREASQPPAAVAAGRLAGSWCEALIAGGVFLLPLICLAGLERPFSTPKLWLLAGLDVVAAGRFLAGTVPDWPWLLWPAAAALSAGLARSVSFEALALALLPLPLCLALEKGVLPARRIGSALLLGSAVESLIALLQYAGLDPLRLVGWQPELFSSTRMRVYGTLGNPDFVAAWLCATLPLYLGAPKRYRFAVTMQAAAILATGSRVLLPALAAAAAMLALRRARVSRWWLAALPAAALLLWFSPARMLATTIQGRLYLARVTVAHWREVPLTGFGPGSFGMQFAGWQIEWLRNHGTAGTAAQFAGTVDHAHNDYLEIWVEYGPVGLGALIALSAWLLAGSWRRRSATIAWSAAAALAAIACVDFPFHRPAEWALYWLLLGTIAARVSRKENQAHV